MNESEALSQHSVHGHCLRSDLILAAWLGRVSLSDRLYPPASGAAVQLPSADLTVCNVHPSDTHAGALAQLKTPSKGCTGSPVTQAGSRRTPSTEVAASEATELE